MDGHLVGVGLPLRNNLDCGGSRHLQVFIVVAIRGQPPALQEPIGILPFQNILDIDLILSPDLLGSIASHARASVGRHALPKRVGLREPGFCRGLNLDGFPPP